MNRHLPETRIDRRRQGGNKDVFYGVLRPHKGPG